MILVPLNRIMLTMRNNSKSSLETTPRPTARGVLTCADSPYFEALQQWTLSLRAVTQLPLFCYNLGLQDHEIRWCADHGLSLLDWTRTSVIPPLPKITD